MIFLTNKFDIYAAILRNTVTKFILKNGPHTKYLKMLKKIHTFEAVNSKNFAPVNIKKLLAELLKCVYIKKIENDCFFSFSVTVCGNFMINKKAFLSLILSLAENASFLNIKTFKKGIYIKCDNFNRSKSFNLLVKKLKATYFYDRKNGIVSLLLFPDTTSKKSQITAKDRDSFHGPLSIINYYLSQ